MYKVSVLFYLGFTLFVCAESTIKINQNSKVDNLVQQVKSAKPSDKRILMNRLKIVLRQSNQTHRMQVMRELKQSFSHKSRIHSVGQNKRYLFKNISCKKHQPKHTQKQNRKGKGSRRRDGGNRH